MLAFQIDQCISQGIFQQQLMDKENIKRNYNERAQANVNREQRETKKTYELKAFNNWIKAVLIQTQTKRMCKLIEKKLDLKANTDNKILHVLDIGCGRGQDIPKWRLARVQYMVAVDFSEECIRSYEERWRGSHEPYQLYTLVQDFTSRNLYYEIEHSFYDIVSAQLCFHYMFGTEDGLRQGLASILSNLLIDGVFIATIPDSYTIIKKIEEKGVVQPDGSRVYGNKYFSIKFDKTDFTSPYGNVYGFYLEEAVGRKNQDGSIEYTNEWLIDLDNLKILLAQQGVEIEQTMNFLEYYKKYRTEYKELFAKFKLIFREGEEIEAELWEIVHLYRVLICKKTSKGKGFLEFDIKTRKESITKEVKRTYDGRNNDRKFSGDHRHNASHRNFNGSRDNHQSRSRDYKRKK